MSKFKSPFMAKSPLKSRKGNKVSWPWGNKRYSGTCLNDDCTRARTHNGKVKKL